MLSWIANNGFLFNNITVVRRNNMILCWKLNFCLNKLLTKKFIYLFVITLFLAAFTTLICDVLPDNNVYQYEYYLAINDVWDVNIEKGFWYILRIFGLLGFSFKQFLFCYYFFFIFLLFKVINRYTSSLWLIIVSYFLYPFIADMIQIRNFGAMVIVLYSLKYLKKFNVFNLIKYILGIIIAAQFHRISYAYAIFLLAYLDVDRIKRLVTLAIFGSLFLLNTDFFYNILLSMHDKTQHYIDIGNVSYFNSILTVFAVLALIATGIYMLKNRNMGQNNVLLLKILLISLLFLPIIMILGNDFLRLNRNLFCLYYCSIFHHTTTHEHIIKIRNRFYWYVSLLWPIMFFVFMDMSRYCYELIFKYLFF